MKHTLFIFAIFSYKLLYCQTDTTCKDIVRSFDRFEDKKSFKSPEKYFIRFIKIITIKDTIYGLSLEANGTTALVGKEGVIMILSDSSKMKFPDTKIKVKYNSLTNRYDYLAMILLTRQDIEILSRLYISAFRLYIFEGTNNDKLGMIARDHLNCILKL